MWARSLGPHNYLCGHLDLSPRVYNNDAWYNVIDDVDPHYLKHFKEFMGAQRDWQSNTKYGKPIQIKGGIPTIFLCNPGPTSSFKEYLDEERNAALKRWALQNAKFFFISEALYSGTNQSPAQNSQEGYSQTESWPSVRVHLLFCNWVRFAWIHAQGNPSLQLRQRMASIPGWSEIPYISKSPATTWMYSWQGRTSSHSRSNSTTTWGKHWGFTSVFWPAGSGLVYVLRPGVS